jgi:hypothetical protein
MLLYAFNKILSPSLVTIKCRVTLFFLNQQSNTHMYFEMIQIYSRTLTEVNSVKIR